MYVIKTLLLVTLLTTNLGESEGVYREFLDYETVSSGVVSGAQAKLWEREQLAGNHYRVMQAASGAETYLRFVEADAGDIEELASGWTAMELLVQDVNALADALNDSPFEILYPPAWISDKENVKAMQATGPAGELVYFSQVVKPETMTLTPVQARSRVDRPFMMVTGSTDLAGALDFYSGELGMRVVGPFPYRIAVLADRLLLPADTMFELAMVSVTPEFALEVDHYPAGSKPSTASPILSISLLVEVGERSAGQALSDFPYAGQPVQLLRGRGGERIELVVDSTAD